MEIILIIHSFIFFLVFYVATDNWDSHPVWLRVLVLLLSGPVFWVVLMFVMGVILGYELVSNMVERWWNEGGRL